MRWNLVVTVALSLLFCKTASGCGCEESIGSKKAKTVFRGEVIKIHKVTAPINRYEITFINVKWVKGGDEKSDTTVVNVYCLMSACCGYRFLFTPHQYEVYTYEENGLLYTGACTDTYQVQKEN
jgi:hypothetical protein